VDLKAAEHGMKAGDLVARLHHFLAAWKDTAVWGGVMTEEALQRRPGGAAVDGASASSRTWKDRFRDVLPGGCAAKAARRQALRGVPIFPTSCPLET
jgi:hypothetical protein